MVCSILKLLFISLSSHCSFSLVSFTAKCHHSLPALARVPFIPQTIPIWLLSLQLYWLSHYWGHPWLTSCTSRGFILFDPSTAFSPTNHTLLKTLPSHWCTGAGSFGLQELILVPVLSTSSSLMPHCSLKLATVTVFTPWKSVNALNQLSFSWRAGY